MEVLLNNEKREDLSLALGFFDGIHLGHKKVIENAVRYAKSNGLKSAVISFSDHPSCLILKRTPEYILSLNDKIKKIQNLGVDYLYLIKFNEKFSNLTKEEYFDFLINMTSPKAITTGFNHFFGKDKQGDSEFLSKICAKNKIVYTKIPPVQIENNIVSSSKIRKAIMNADFETAKTMLNYDFYIKNNVIKGQQIGRELGYKTINLNYPEKIIKIPYGVYCTLCEIEGKKYKSVTNWGVKPTISNNNPAQIETHIFDLDKDLYNKTAKITFLKKIRDEKKFDNLENLKTQIKQDVEFCMNYI